MDATRRLTAPAGALLLGCAYGAGLATGLARFPDPLLVVGAAFGIAIWRPRAPGWPTMLAVVAGVLMGDAVRRHERTSCAATLPLGETPSLPAELAALVKIETGVTDRIRRGLKVTALRITVLDGTAAGTVINLGNARAKARGR